MANPKVKVNSLTDLVSVVRTAKQGCTMKSRGTGTALVTIKNQPYEIKNALCIDGLDTNLLSLGRIQENDGTYYSMDHNVMIIQMGETTFEAITNPSDGLYHIANVRNNDMVSSPAVVLLRQTNEHTYWHDVLGHAGSRNLIPISKYYNIPHKPHCIQCKPCIMYKLTYKPYQQRPKEMLAKEKLSRMHSDMYPG